jgi:hypothetical protein
LIDHRYNFGGSVFDLDNGNTQTLVGQAFIDYQSIHLTPPDLFPANLSIAPVSYNSDRKLVNYRLDIGIGNTQFADASCAQV